MLKINFTFLNKGASGAGKTTLLNVLNFRNRGDLKIGGNVKLNGQIVTSTAQLASISGYVQQEDLFFGTLKVKEQLKFQVFNLFILYWIHGLKGFKKKAMLKMENIFTKEEKNKRVEEVLNQVITHKLYIKKIESISFSF